MTIHRVKNLQNGRTFTRSLLDLWLLLMPVRSIARSGKSEKPSKSHYSQGLRWNASYGCRASGLNIVQISSSRPWIQLMKLAKTWLGRSRQARFAGTSRRWAWSGGIFGRSDSLSLLLMLTTLSLAVPSLYGFQRPWREWMPLLHRRLRSMVAPQHAHCSLRRRYHRYPGIDWYVCLSLPFESLRSWLVQNLQEKIINTRFQAILKVSLLGVAFWRTLNFLSQLPSYLCDWTRVLIQWHSVGCANILSGNVNTPFRTQRHCLSIIFPVSHFHLILSSKIL